VANTDDLMRTTLNQVAPGTALRDGLERILRGNTGALIVVGYDKLVESICGGGFDLDVDFSATRLRELSKMDGACVINSDLSKIVKASVQLVPDSTIETAETGTRHRTAERVAKQTGYPVISVSQSMKIIALYVDGRRYVLDDSAAILSRANQALATLERYKMRLDEVAGTLSALEIEDLVTVRDAMAVSQRLEMVRRIESERELVVRDYLLPGSGKKAKKDEDALAELNALSGTDLLDLSVIARAVGYAAGADQLEIAVSPRGYRLLAKVPRLPNPIVDRLIEHFGGLQKLLAASIDDLQAVEGVGETRARSVREGLSRLAESSILERYV
jgi:diadenylate cyclase